MIDGTSVYESRLHMGEQLAEKIRGIPEAQDIDVVIPIPDSSRPSALELANTLGLKYREGFVKNRYIGRTFIMPGQAMRKKSVRQKLNPIGMEFKDKVVLLVDDSIVRGTTSRARSCRWRARPARARCTSPRRARRCAFPNVYGIDMPNQRRAGRHRPHRGRDRARDRRRSPDLPGPRRAEGRGARRRIRRLKEFEASCFDGKYITGDVTADYLSQLAAERDVARGETRTPMPEARRAGARAGD